MHSSQPSKERPQRLTPLFKSLAIAHFLSMIGTALTGYGVALWYLGQHHAISGYSFLVFSAVAPGIVVTPFVGVWIDRIDRRIVMLLGHATSALCSLMIIFLYAFDRLTLWAILPCVLISSASNALLTPAFISVVTQMVSRARLGQISGLMGMVQAMILIVIPPLSALLVHWNGLKSILAIDVTTFTIAITTLLLIRLPAIETKEKEGLFWSDFRAGVAFILTRPPLRNLIAFFWVMAFSVASVNVLLPPLVLTFGTTTDVARVLASGGGGALIGGMLLAIWGEPKRKMATIVGCSLLAGLSYLLILFPVALWRLMVMAALVMFCHAIVMGCNQVLWQHKVPISMQGRVFSIASALAFSAIPLGYLAAGFLVEQLITPLLSTQTPFAICLTSRFGEASGAGMVVMIALIGLGVVMYSGTSLFRSVLMDIEQSLPDQLPHEPLHEPLHEPQAPHDSLTSK